MNHRADMIVSGVVQYVGFRHVARGMARQCRLKGEVENLEDDTVRITCEGGDEDINRFVEEIRNAQKPIEVDDIQIEYSEPTGEFKNFRITMGDQLAEMSEGFGTGATYFREMLGKQDVVINEIRSLSSNMRDKQDQMLGKQDQMLGKQDVVINEIRSLSSNMRDKQDQMLGKQDVVINEIRSLSSNMRDMMDQRFQRLEDEIAKIKAKIP